MTNPNYKRNQNPAFNSPNPNMTPNPKPKPIPDFKQNPNPETKPDCEPNPMKANAAEIKELKQQLADRSGVV